jgi:Tol biopolymer transport system component
MTRHVAPIAGALAPLLLLALSACPKPLPPVGQAPTDRPATPASPPWQELAQPDETHLRGVRQLTFGGENAEAYWSFDGRELIYQSTRTPYACDQILRQAVDDPDRVATLVSTGKGRTTCAYFLQGDQDIVYASTHEVGPECPKPPDMSMGYVWALYDFDIYRAKRDGSGLHKLIGGPSYDAEATVCGKDGSIIFTSDRDGDLELYRMDADGKNVLRLTHTPGYDGGAFFSQDCSKIVWRASRPSGDALADYQRLLGQRLVRPSKLEIFVANADGSDARQVTYLQSASFAPYLHPSGQRILFSTNYPDPRGREFDIWAIDVDGTDLERVTYAPGFDGFPMFSPDGKRLAFASNRRDAGAAGADGKPTYRMTGGAIGETDTNVFVADWVDHPARVAAPSAADRFARVVTFLADDARDGRGVGTAGLEAATVFVEAELAAAGVEPGMGAGVGYRQSFEVTTGLTVGPTTRVVIDGEVVPATDFAPLAFSGKKAVKARPVRVGWGIVAPEAKLDDYKGVAARGKVAVVHRFTPMRPELDTASGHRRYGDLEYKAFTARQRGAAALIVIDDGETKNDEVALPSLDPRTSADAGIPALVIKRAWADKLSRAKLVEVQVELVPTRTATHNVLGVIRGKGAGSGGKRPAVVVGAHLDHLGVGKPGASLDAAGGIHNGADDNASGVAALLEVGRRLVEAKDQLDRDVWLVAFSAEEMGVLGSDYLVKHPPWTGPVLGMLNMDMVGRLRGNALTVLGGDTAPEWAGLVGPACAAARVECALSGTGFGPSDHMPFYIGGAPVLHFFTGSHLDYHKTSDDSTTINAAGGAQVAQVVGDVALALARTGAPTLSYKKVAPPAPSGDVRRAGASLGTVPSYNEDPNAPPGMVISDVVPDGAAAKAGLLGGDRIVKLGAIDIRNVGDLMFVLSTAKPGETVRVTFVRAGKQQSVDAVYGQPRSRR